MAPTSSPPEARRAAAHAAAAAPASAPDAASAPGGIVPQELAHLAQELGVALDPAQCAGLIAFAALLRRWNRVHNLTAIDSDEELLTHHLLDCLAIVPPLHAALEAARRRLGASADPAGVPFSFLDAGTGAGLPGIPLALLHPHWQAQLVDAVQKKCAFLLQAQLELGLRNVHVHHARLERCRLAPQALIVSRAFASLRDFVTLTRPLLAPGGIWAAMKGRRPDDEIAALPAGIEVLDTITLRVPRLDEQRHLVLLRDAAAAPA